MRGRESGWPAAILLTLALLAIATACRQIPPPAPGPAPPWDTPRPSPTPPPANHVRVLASWRGGDEVGFLRALETFTDQTGITVEYTGEAEVADALLAHIEAGTPPDVVLLPKINWLWELASAEAIPPLDPETAQAVRTHYAPTWVALASYDGKLYGVPFRTTSKSLLWYRPDAVDTSVPPETLNDLETTAAHLADKGLRPFTVPGGEGGGWPLTDWFENVLLAEAGPEVYEALARHEISWTDPAIRRAARRLVELLRNEWLLGGAEGTVKLALAESFEATFVPDRPRAVFWLGLGPVVDGQLHKFPNLRPHRNIAVTAFPAGGVVGIVDTAVALNAREETRRLMAFLASPEAPRLWIEHGGYFISPNSDVPASAYPDAFRAFEAHQLQTAPTFVYDLSDRLPRLLTQELQKSLQALLQHPEQLDQILENLESVATREQGFR